MAANRLKGVFFFDFGGDEPQLADLDKSIRQTVVCLLQFLVFHRELPGNPFMGYSLSHVFGNIRFRSEYQWTPFLSCINIQFEFVRCFGSLCYSIDILAIDVCQLWLSTLTSVRFVSSTLWGNQRSRSRAGCPILWESIIPLVADGTHYFIFDQHCRLLPVPPINIQWSGG